MPRILNTTRQNPAHLYPHAGWGWDMHDDNHGFGERRAFLSNPDGYPIHAKEGSVCQGQDGTVFRLMRGRWVPSVTCLTNYPYVPFLEFHPDEESRCEPGRGVHIYDGVITKPGARPARGWGWEMYTEWYPEDYLGKYSVVNESGTLFVKLIFKETL